MAKKIVCIVGTRPEAIKMAPVIKALRNQPWAQVRVLATAQHREMMDQVLGLFKIQPDIDLNIMQPNQGLAELTARLIRALDDKLAEESPDLVLAQGDTTTVMVASLVAFYRRIPFGHVEAGLRTGDLDYPFPEEMNRVVAGHLSRLHFAPTESSSRNLAREGIPANQIHVTGNTVIDALLEVAEKEVPIGVELDPGKKMVLVTAHRRENFGPPFENVCRAIRQLAESNDDVEFLYPVHPNPNVVEVANRLLKDHPRIHLCKPLDYAPFVSAMKRACFLLTDSGGVQEEAPALGKPVLVLRAETERPEALSSGDVKLVGTDFQKIVGESQKLLSDEQAYRAMAIGVSPYGDGMAAGRIAEIIRRYFELG